MPSFSASSIIFSYRCNGPSLSTRLHTDGFQCKAFLVWQVYRLGGELGYLSGDAICHFLPDSLIADAFTVISPRHGRSSRGGGTFEGDFTNPALQGGPRALWIYSEGLCLGSNCDSNHAEKCISNCWLLPQLLKVKWCDLEFWPKILIKQKSNISVSPVHDFWTHQRML